LRKQDRSLCPDPLRSIVQRLFKAGSDIRDP
jgi:hypothetical protein